MASFVSFVGFFRLSIHSEFNVGGIVMICFSRYTALVATRFIGRYYGTRHLVTSHTWDSFRQENAFLISTSISHSLSGGIAHGCTEVDGGVADAGVDKEVLQSVSLTDSRCRPGGSSEARFKTTGARAEARVVGTTQPLAPEVSMKRTGHLGHRGLIRRFATVD